MRAIAAAGALALALTACAPGAPSPPSAEDMRAALQRNPQVMAGSMAWATVGGLFGGQSDPEEVRRRLSVARGDCVDARPNPGFVCDFAVTLDGNRMPGGELRGRFFRIENQWNVEIQFR